MSSPVILVVEDEPILRMAAVAMLEDAGLPALSAHDTDSAATILATCPTISVLFTDVDLGRGRDGLWLAEHVRDQRPDIRVIVTSGHRAVAEGRMPDGAIFFGKPYPEEAVVAEVRKMIPVAPPTTC